MQPGTAEQVRAWSRRRLSWIALRIVAIAAVSGFLGYRARGTRGLIIWVLGGAFLLPSIARFILTWITRHKEPSSTAIGPEGITFTSERGSDLLAWLEIRHLSYTGRWIGDNAALAIRTKDKNRLD